ncbi:MAG: SNF2-related protein [Methanoregula sp.]|nr:SNF2-related protein [Methanoregula sp.]
MFKDPASSNIWLWSTEHQQAVQLITPQEISGETFYRAWVPGKNIVTLNHSSQFLPLSDAKPFSYEEIICRAAAGKITESVNQETLLSPLCSNVIPLPHQIYALTRAFEKETIRYLFADEVGLGKTIEAGLVIKELKLRNKIKRVLILAPKGLVPQWVEEMRQKIGHADSIYN